MPSRRSTPRDCCDREALRAVLDANVLISALLSRSGAPARILLGWQAGRFELIVSAQLLAELLRALGYPRLQRSVPTEDAEAFVALLARSATLVPDPANLPPVSSPDPADDYLLALAAEEHAVLVSGDRHLLSLTAEAPVRSPADFLALLASDF